MRCPIHETPLNGNGECLLCELVSGALDDRVLPGGEAEHQFYKNYAQQIERENIEKALKQIEAHERDSNQTI
jgi:hypothetical protein